MHPLKRRGRNGGSKGLLMNGLEADPYIDVVDLTVAPIAIHKTKRSTPEPQTTAIQASSENEKLVKLSKAAYIVTASFADMGQRK